MYKLLLLAAADAAEALAGKEDHFADVRIYNPYASIICVFLQCNNNLHIKIYALRCRKVENGGRAE